MRRWGLLVSLLSMASIGYELLLLRLFSIIYPYHLAFLIISLALLGIGAAGTFLTLKSGWLVQRFPSIFSLSAIGFGLGVSLSFAVAQAIPFHPRELAWNPSLAFRLMGIYVILSVPFFFSGSGISLALTRFAEKAPLRYIPGMSLTCSEEPPNQLGVYVDGDLSVPITRFRGRQDALQFLDCQPSSLPYHLLDHPDVLIPGAGGGMEVLRALHYKARGVYAVEENPDIIDVVRERFSEFSGRIYERANVRLFTGGIRTFLASTSKSFDLIQISFGTAGQRAALKPFHLFTEEGLESCLAHLRHGGLLAVTQWAQLPPRDSLRLFLTALRLLEDRGITSPGEHVALIRSWRTTTLLVRRDPFGPSDLRKIRDFCSRLSFDLVHIPGMRTEEANRYNHLRNPSYFQAVRALLGKHRERFLHKYKFLIRPVTDRHPFFFHFFRWKTLPEVLSLMRSGGISLLEWSYPLLCAALLVAGASGAILILLPLAFIRRADNRSKGVRSFAVVGFFFSLGVGFMFLEMAFFQRFTLYLGHPVLSASVVISALLISAGGGSGCSSKWRTLFAGNRKRLPPMDIPAAAAGIVIWSLLLLAGLPHIFEWSIGFPTFLRTLLAVLMITPLGFLMGMVFPLGLERLAGSSVKHIPWAWGINGCASVVSTILASLLALELGFNGVILLAVCMYAAAAAWSLVLMKRGLA